MKSKIYYILNIFFDFAINFLLNFFKFENAPKTLLLLRMDAIGDYILFRNFLKVIRESSKYNDYEITLCGNTEWKKLSLELDKKYFDNSIWINCKQYTNNPLYRLRQIMYIHKRGFETVIHPTYSRVFQFDFLVKFSGAKFRIGSSGDTINQPKVLKNITDKYYTKLIPTSDNVIFEFYRNREFFENFLQVDFNNINLEIEAINATNYQLPEEFILIFPSAGHKLRKWHHENFAILADYFYNKYNIKSVISGGTNDLAISKNIIDCLKNINAIVDLTGKSSLPELVQLINKSKMLISNETSAVHIAAGLNKNTICISNGNHIFRFNYYPSGLSDCIRTVYPKEIESFLNNRNYLVENYYNKKNLDINSIPVERIISEIENNFL